MLSTLGVFSVSPVPPMPLTRPSEEAELLGATAKTFQISLLQKAGASPPGPHANHSVPLELPLNIPG